jgi:hypothetical protein
LYGDAPETSFDIDIVSKKDAVPASTLDQVAMQAVEDSQDSFFVARRVKPDVGRARPELFQTGVEAYFTKPVAPDGQEIKDMYSHLQQRGVQGFTLIVDPRKKPGAMADQVIGVRFLDIPQFYDAENFANMSDAAYRQHVLSKQDEYRQIGDELKRTFGNIRTADPAYFDVNVKSKGGAADYVTQLSNPERDSDVLRQEFWGFKPARTRFKEYAGQSRPYYSQGGEGARAAQSGFASPALLGGTAVATAGGIAAAEAYNNPAANFVPSPNRTPIQVGPQRLPEQQPFNQAFQDVEQLRGAHAKYANLRQQKREFWDARKRDVLDLANSVGGFLSEGASSVMANSPMLQMGAAYASQLPGERMMTEADIPLRSLYAGGGALIDAAQGDPLQAIGANAQQVMQQGSEQTAYDLGGRVTDALSPYVPNPIAAGAGTIANAGSQILSPF